jgi:hypothetical protein
VEKRLGTRAIFTKLLKIFVTLSLNILGFLRLKVFFKQIPLEVDVSYNKNNEIPIFMCDSFSNPS